MYSMSFLQTCRVHIIIMCCKKSCLLKPHIHTDKQVNTENEKLLPLLGFENSHSHGFSD